MKKVIAFILTALIAAIISIPHFSYENPQSIFTPEEREWLKAHPLIKVAPDSNYAPVEFFEDGAYQGLAMDYLNWISKNFDIEFQYVTYDSWSDIITALKNHEIDLQTGIIKTAERSS